MLCQRHITPPHCLSKETTLNPRIFALMARPPPGSYRRRQSPKRPELRERLKNTHVKAQVKLGRCRHAMSTSHHATALPVKGNNPKPKDICSDGPAPPGSIFSSISSCGTLSFAPCRLPPGGAWSTFNSNSSCGTLRLAPWRLALAGYGPCLVTFFLVAH